MKTKAISAGSRLPTPDGIQPARQPGRNGPANRAVAAACIIALALNSGCLTNTSGIEGTAAQTGGPGNILSTNKHILVNNKSLGKAIEIVDIRTTRSSNDLMMVNVDLVSNYRKALNVKYKFCWYDAQGMEIDPDSRAWTPLVLYGKETKAVQGTAPNSRATEFKIKIRE